MPSPPLPLSDTSIERPSVGPTAPSLDTPNLGIATAQDCLEIGAHPLPA